MFSSKPTVPENPELEKLIVKATDETLTSDNWQYILDVCDSISSTPEESTKQAIKYITARLNLKDANVNLRTLSLIVAVAENCGSRMKQEIASKSFLHDTLLKKLSDRKLHKTIKFKVAEVISQLNGSFKNDPSLKPMADAYHKLTTQYGQYVNGKTDSFEPTKPAKREITQADKVKEEEDLQRVLKLSLHDYERDQTVRKAYLNEKPLPETKTGTDSGSIGDQKEESQEEPSKTIATVSKVRALYDLVSYEQDELSFRKGDVITVIESVYRDWWKGSLPNGKEGIFPLNYVTPIVSKSPQQLAKEAQLENKILNVDSRVVDKLLALLSSATSGPSAVNVSEDEITQLYNKILPLRPTLAESIDKYAARKEELMTLNAQLTGQIKFYNQSVDNSISRKISNEPNPYGNYHNYERPIATQPTSDGFGNQYPPPQMSPSHMYSTTSIPGSSSTPQPYQHVSPQHSQQSSQQFAPQQSQFAPQQSQYPPQQYPPQNAQQPQQQYAPYPASSQLPDSPKYSNINKFPDVGSL